MTIDQVAIVASLRTDMANDGTAYERFTAAGPDGVAAAGRPRARAWRTLVWAARPEDAERLMALDDAGVLPAVAGGLRLARGPRAANWVGGRSIHWRCRAAQRPRRSASCCSAMPRSHCIRWQGRDSTSACAMRRNWPNCWSRKAGGCREPPRCWPVSKPCVRQIAKESSASPTRWCARSPAIIRCWRARAMQACCCSTCCRLPSAR